MLQVTPPAAGSWGDVFGYAGVIVSDHHSLVQDVSVAAVKVVPPATIYALTLNEWLAVAAIVYTVLQTAHLVWKWAGEWRRARRLKERNS